MSRRYPKEFYQQEGAVEMDSDSIQHAESENWLDEDFVKTVMRRRGQGSSFRYLENYVHNHWNGGESFLLMGPQGCGKTFAVLREFRDSKVPVDYWAFKAHDRLERLYPCPTEYPRLIIYDDLHYQLESISRHQTSAASLIELLRKISAHMKKGRQAILVAADWVPERLKVLNISEISELLEYFLEPPRNYLVEPPGWGDVLALSDLHYPEWKIDDDFALLVHSICPNPRTAMRLLEIIHRDGCTFQCDNFILRSQEKAAENLELHPRFSKWKNRQRLTEHINEPVRKVAYRTPAHFFKAYRGFDRHGSPEQCLISSLVFELAWGISTF